jgi:hypothetical protein
MNTLKQIIKDIKKGENISLVAIVLLVVITLILKGLGIASDSLVDSLTLAMLGLIAIGFLGIRYRIAEIIERESSLVDSANAIQLLDRFPVLLDEYLEKADEILMLGLILRSTTYSYYDEFTDRVRKGLKLKVLITNPSSQYIHMDQITYRFSRGETTELFRAAFMTILEQYTRIHKAAIKADNMQLRLLDFVPPFGLYMFPNEKEGGMIFVQIYAHRAPEGAAPKFVISELGNPIWYKRLQELFEKMWEDGVDYFPEV